MKNGTIPPGTMSRNKLNPHEQTLKDININRLLPRKNLQTIKTWLGDGAWNLNRFGARGDTPGITKEQLAKIKAPYPISTCFVTENNLKRNPGRLSSLKIF